MAGCTSKYYYRYIREKSVNHMLGGMYTSYRHRIPR